MYFNWIISRFYYLNSKVSNQKQEQKEIIFCSLCEIDIYASQSKQNYLGIEESTK